MGQGKASEAGHLQRGNLPRTWLVHDMLWPSKCVFYSSGLP